MTLSRLTRPIVFLAGIIFTLACPAGHAVADPAPISESPASRLVIHKLILHNVTPDEVVILMHWKRDDKDFQTFRMLDNKPLLGDGINRVDPPKPPASTSTLPEGVENIYVLEGDNSLLIEATPEGFKRTQEIVKSLDTLLKRNFQFKIQFVRARIDAVKSLGLFPTTDERFQRTVTFGTQVSALLQTLLAKGSVVLETRTLNADNGVSLLISYVAKISTPKGSLSSINETLDEVIGKQWQNFLVPAFSITLRPHLFVDGTITLRVKPMERSYELQSGQTTTTSLSEPAARTIQSGEMLAIGGLMTGQEHELLVFITPTLLPQQQAPTGQTPNSVPTGDKP